MGSSSRDLFLHRSIQVSTQNSTRKKEIQRITTPKSGKSQCSSVILRRDTGQEFTTSCSLAQITQLTASQFNGLCYKLEGAAISTCETYTISCYRPPHPKQDKSTQLRHPTSQHQPIQQPRAHVSGRPYIWTNRAPTCSSVACHTAALCL